jgi:hypothetical protein
MNATEIIGKVIGFILLVTVLTLIFAWPVQWLWNNSLVGAIDGVNPITFWQALGINFLVSLLIGSKNSTTKKSE